MYILARYRNDTISAKKKKKRHQSRKVVGLQLQSFSPSGSLHSLQSRRILWICRNINLVVFCSRVFDLSINRLHPAANQGHCPSMLLDLAPDTYFCTCIPKYLVFLTYQHRFQEYIPSGTALRYEIFSDLVTPAKNLHQIC